MIFAPINVDTIFQSVWIIRVLKFNVATVMQKPDYIFIIEIFGREYILS